MKPVSSSLENEIKVKINELADSLAKQKMHNATLTALLSKKATDPEVSQSSQNTKDESDIITAKLSALESSITKQAKKQA